MKFIKRHKFIFFLIVVVIAGGGYYWYGKSNSATAETRYVVANVEKGTITSFVSGTGQVSVTNQVDVKAKASGDIVTVNVADGQEVKSGALLAVLNTRDAQKAVRDAQANLDSAKLSLDKLKQPADELSILQAQNSLVQANESKQNATDNLSKSYDDGFNSVANTFLDLPAVAQGLNDILYGNTLGGNGQFNVDYYIDAIKVYDDGITRYKSDAVNSYKIARAAYDKNFNDYKMIDRSASRENIERIVDETYDTTKSLAEAVKSTNNLIQFYKDRALQHNLKYNTVNDTYLANLNTYTGKTNSHLTDLLSIINAFKDDKDAIMSADRTIQEKTQSIAKLKAGADPLDIKSQLLSIQQRVNSLQDAKDKLADYYVRAPFDGVVAKVNVKVGDAAGSASIVTLITKQKTADISLNEVDVAKVKVGQKATLTFDAVTGLSISGEVVNIDSIGTVSQGVVSYNVTIKFDTQDTRIKTGMSVSASIITEIKQEILLVPNSAVKAQNNSSYVEMFDAPLPAVIGNQGVASVVAPRQQSVEIGISNDSSTEIISGLKVGDQIVTKTIIATTTTQSAPSILQSVGGNRAGGGGATRVPGVGR